MTKSFTECELCEKEFSGPENYAQHLMSKGHIKKLSDKRASEKKLEPVAPPSSNQPKYRCEICDTDVSGPEPLEQHYKGSKHKNMLNKKRILEEQGVVAAAGGGPSAGTGTLTCATCEKCFSGPESYEDHIKSKKHQRKVELTDMKDRITNSAAPSCPPPPADTQVQLQTGGLYPELSRDPSVPRVPVRAEAKNEVPKKPKGCFGDFKNIFKKKKQP